MKSLIKFPGKAIRLSGLRCEDFGAEAGDAEPARLMDERQIWTAPADGRLGLGYATQTGSKADGKG